MKEHRAPEAGDTGPQVVRQGNDDVVEAVGSPHFFVAGRVGKPDGPVVVAVSRAVTPSHIDAQRHLAKFSVQVPGAIRAAEKCSKTPPANGCGTVAFALHGTTSGTAQGAGNSEVADHENASHC
jgi:hypothetical protein